MDTESWMTLQIVYEQWRFFPPDRLTFTGSREAGRKFSSVNFPPLNASFTAIELDPVYGGPSVPFGGACQLITSYLISVPNFGESLRVINLIGQCVSQRQVSELFSETLSARLPKLKSASFRIFAFDPNVRLRYKLHIPNAIAPPELEHLEIYMNMFASYLSREMIAPIVPLIKKVKHLGWFSLSRPNYNLTELIDEQLDSLKIIEAVGGTSWDFGTFPSDVMPTLERIIVHDYQFSYSIELQQIYRSVGRPFDMKQNVLDDHDQHKNVFCGTTAILHLKGKVNSVERIRGNPNIRALTLRPSKHWASDLSELKALPLMSTLVNLETVHIMAGDMLACFSPFGQHANPDEFEFPSVRHLRFIGKAAYYNCDLYTTLLQMFPNLDTLVNLPIGCLKGGQLRDERGILRRLRKLVLLHADVSLANEILMSVLQLKQLDTLFLRLDGGAQFPLELIDELKLHQSLRHVGVIVEGEPRWRNNWNLPPRRMVAELAEAWSSRDWMAMFFIYQNSRVCGETNVISATHHGEGNIDYGEMRGVAFSKVILAFPQFYTLAWQYLESRVHPK